VFIYYAFDPKEVNMFTFDNCFMIWVDVAQGYVNAIFFSEGEAEALSKSIHGHTDVEGPMNFAKAQRVLAEYGPSTFAS
jgi:hypothetical protein